MSRTGGPAADVSIVLNLHREGVLLARTLRSLTDTVLHARAKGVSAELVIVLDMADQATRDVAAAVTPGAFTQVRRIEVANRSLGPSRNDGVDLAEGALVMTVDGDDLYSFNYLAAMHAAVHGKGRVIAYPEYSINFGRENYMHRLLPLSRSGRFRLAGTHTFASCLMAPRELLRELRYRDCAHSTVYAYEDYDMNLRAVAAGVDIHVGEDAVLFYRKHDRSIMAALPDAAHFIAPPSAFYAPATYLSGEWREGEGPKPSEAARWMEAFSASARLAEIVSHASSIEPEIDMATIATAPLGTAAAFDPSLGAAYDAICRDLGAMRFTDVALLGAAGPCPPLTARLLAASGAALAISEGRRPASLPTETRHLDLPAIGAGLDPFRRAELTLRVLQNFTETPRLHLVPCALSDNVLHSFGEALQPFRTIVHDVAVAAPSQPDCGGADTAAWLSHAIDAIDLVVSDEPSRVTALVDRSPRSAAKAKLLRREGAPMDDDLAAAYAVLATKSTETRWTTTP